MMYESPKTTEELLHRLTTATLDEGPSGSTCSWDPPEMQSDEWGWETLWEYAVECLHLLDPTGEITQRAFDAEPHADHPHAVKDRIAKLPTTLEGRVALAGQFFTPRGDDHYLIGWRHKIALEGIRAMVTNPHEALVELIRRGDVEAQHYMDKGLGEMDHGVDIAQANNVEALMKAAGAECLKTGKSVQIFGKGGFAEKFNAKG